MLLGKMYNRGGGWGWPAGWVVGKSDFNENPVVSLDLDLDFGLRLRVCQKQETSNLVTRGFRHENIYQ